MTDNRCNKYNHDTKIDNLISCVTFGDHCSHPNGIEMRVINLIFYIVGNRVDQSYLQCVCFHSRLLAC